MNCAFELFGFCIDKEFELKSFWIGSFTLYDTIDTNGKNWNVLLIGRSQSKWILELFGLWLLGPKETFLKDR